MTVTVHISEDSSELRLLLRRRPERDTRLNLSMPRSFGSKTIAAIRETGTPVRRGL